MRDLLSNMQMIELKPKRKMKVKCPVCNEIVFFEDGDRRGGLHFTPKEPYTCDHISAEVEIFDYELENAPTDYYIDGYNKDSNFDDIYDQMEKQKYMFSAQGYFPKFFTPRLEEPEDLKKFLEERKPDYFVKIKYKEGYITRYYFFNKISFGFLER